MYLQGLFAVFGLFWLALADVTAQIDGDGVTQIYGNSFGVPGVDVTYEYVVSRPMARKRDGRRCILILTIRSLEEVPPATQ